MIKKRAIKKCRGINKALGYGCGEKKEIEMYGLCKDCKKEWLFNTPEGNEVIKKFSLRAKKENEKTKRAKIRKEKEEIKRKSDYESELQSIINEIVRLIDHDEKCISCDYPKDGEWTRQAHASHYHSRGSNPALRYHMFNIFKSCSICNNYEHSNNKGYRKGITERFGPKLLDYMDDLPKKYPELHLTREDLAEAIKKAKFVRKSIIEGKDYTREEINRIVGIYK